MRLLSTFILHLGLAMGLVFSISAQKPISHSAPLANPWVAYLNECSVWLNKNHHSFVDINQNINQYLRERESSDSTYLIKRYSISYPLWKQLQEEDIPDAQKHLRLVYDRAMTLADSLPASHKKDITDRMKKAQKLMDQYFELCKTIENSTLRSDYLRGMLADSVYAWLDAYSLACFDFSALQYILYQEIEDTYTPQATPVTINDMQLLVSSCGQLIFSLRRNDAKMARKNVESIGLLLTHFDPMEETSPSLKNRPRLDNKPFSGFIAKAREIKALGEHYLLGVPDYPKSKPWLAEYGPAYFYGNEMISLYSAKKEGLVSFYNEFTRSSKIEVLAKCAEPYWFPVLRVADTHPLEPLNVDSLIQSFQEKLIVEKNLPLTPSLDGYASNNLVFLLDISASMNRPEKMPLLKEALKYFLDLTRSEDQIAIVTYSGTAKIALPPTPANQKEKILRAIEDLHYSGKTDAGRGLQMAYKQAADYFIEKGNNRIILATDGEFELEKSMLKLIRTHAEKGIKLTAFSFGRFVDKDINEFMRRITTEGGGHYAHIQEGEGAFEALMTEAKAIRKE